MAKNNVKNPKGFFFLCWELLKNRVGRKWNVPEKATPVLGSACHRLLKASNMVLVTLQYPVQTRLYFPASWFFAPLPTMPVYSRHRPLPSFYFLPLHIFSFEGRGQFYSNCRSSSRVTGSARSSESCLLRREVTK